MNELKLQTDLLNKLLFLDENSKCCVWYSRSVYPGSELDLLHDRSGLLVVWNSSNTKKCPSQKQLDAVDQEEANQAALERNENRRKENRNQQAKKDLGLMANYQNYKKENPEVSFSQYLDSLESIEI